MPEDNKIRVWLNTSKLIPAFQIIKVHFIFSKAKVNASNAFKQIKVIITKIICESTIFFWINTIITHNTYNVFGISDII